jgi:hypothetical protein
MSRYIDDQELEEFVWYVVGGEYTKATKIAKNLFAKISEHKAYLARAECSCEVNKCICYLPFESRPLDIQAGDAFRQITPDGRELILGALGVRRPAEGVMEIFTAGWPAAIVRIPDHGRVELVRKGNGITKAELRHRRDKGWGDWEDGL